MRTSVHRGSLCLVVTLHNVEHLVDRLLDSLALQTGARHVFVDDLSTDGTVHRVLARGHAVHRIDDKMPGGVAFAGNFGERLCPDETDYVAWVDGDDWLHPNFSEVITGAIRAAPTPPDVVLAGYDAYDASGEHVVKPLASETRLWARPCPAYARLTHSDHPCYADIVQANPLPGRRTHRRNGPCPIAFPESTLHYEDNPQWWNMVACRPMLAMVSQRVYAHRSSRSIGSRDGDSLAEFLWHARYVSDVMHASTRAAKSRGEVARGDAEVARWLKTLQWILARESSTSVRVRTGSVLHALSETQDALVQGRSPAIATHYDMSVVIPMHDASTWTDVLLTNIRTTFARAERFECSVEFILVVGASLPSKTSELQRLQDEFGERVLLLAHRGPTQHAGILRNFAIPFLRGTHVAFWDSDDVAWPDAWMQALIAHRECDLIFVRYDRIVRRATRDGASPRGRAALHMMRQIKTWDRLPMFSGDDRIWRRKNGTGGPLDFVNFPWTRLIRTSLLHRHYIHFGVERVHNDVLYHWMSLRDANTIAYHDAIGISHVYYNYHEQITEVGGRDRESVTRSLRLVHRRLVTHQRWSDHLKPRFVEFVTRILAWARSHFKLSASFHKECNFTMQCVRSDSAYGCVRWTHLSRSLR